MTVIFYDIPSTVSGKAWNPTTWRTRFVLNYKGIPYTTEWVEYPDIAEHNKKLGLKPTGKTLWDGSDYYTLPAIYDTTTKKYLNDTWEIAIYLETQYPETPSIFHNNTHALQAAFIQAHSDAISALYPLILPSHKSIFTPRSAEYFVTTREQAFGMTLDELLPKGDRAISEWTRLKEGLGKIDVWFAKTDSEGPFILGNKVSYADFVVSSYTMWWKTVWGESSKKWKTIASWHGGRWNNLLLELDKYTSAA